MSAQYVKQFNADMGELALNVVGESHWRRYASNRVAAINSSTVNKKVLFLKKSIEQIEITINGEAGPYILEKGVVKDDFEWVKDVLKTFAEKNKVSYTG